MISDKENTHLSKILSYALRHDPHQFGIELNVNGWVDVNTLLTKLEESGQKININVLTHVVTTNANQRFAFNDDLSMIRANQGHSVEVQLDHPAVKPPEFLYHGTIGEYIPGILKDGLRKMDRRHVHLSADILTAKKVGERRGKPVILKIKAGAMFRDGYIFYLSANGVWLTDAVPPGFIDTSDEGPAL